MGCRTIARAGFNDRDDGPVMVRTVPMVSPLARSEEQKHRPDGLLDADLTRCAWCRSKKIYPPAFAL